MSVDDAEAPSRRSKPSCDGLARAGRVRDEETAEHVERMARSCAVSKPGPLAVPWDAPAATAARSKPSPYLPAHTDIGRAARLALEWPVDCWAALGAAIAVTSIVC